MNLASGTFLVWACVAIITGLGQPAEHQQTSLGWFKCFYQHGQPSVFSNSYILFLNLCHSFSPSLLLMKREENKDGRRVKETEIKWWAAVSHCVSLKDIDWVIYSRRFIRPSVFSDRFGAGMYVCVFVRVNDFYLWRGREERVLMEGQSRREKSTKRLASD